MSWSARLGALDRVQRSRGFKVGASIAVVVLALVVAVGYAVYATSGDTSLFTVNIPADIDPEARAAIERRAETLERIVSAHNSVGLVASATAIGAALSLVVIWIGLALTYLGLIVLAACVGLVAFFVPGLRDEAVVALGAVALAASFGALLRGLGLLFSGPGPVLAGARTVLTEAVRMKISLVFIVVLVIALALLPVVLDGSQPLRYRVQAFLQYATGIGFWTVATLVLVFTVASITSEQRDRIIWQTVTKPVAAWQYLLGKWLGVAGLAAVLLAVTGSGVFLFTEYLRGQPALGESAPYIPAGSNQQVTEDRLILETRVLAARLGQSPTMPFDLNGPEVTRAVDAYIERERRQRGNDWEPTSDELINIRNEQFNQMSTEYRSIDPRLEGFEDFLFEGLQEATKSNLPITLRYKIDAGGNRPDQFYALAFEFPDVTPINRPEVGLGYSHTITLPAGVIDEEGRVLMRVYNGSLAPGPNGLRAFRSNTGTVTIPPDGLEISYAVGSYRLNFLRVMLVLWMKLGLIAMIAVWASSYLSFPVACLVSIGAFLVAEGSSFVRESVEYFGNNDPDGNFQLWRYVANLVAETVSSIFSVYSDLRPTDRIADGRLMSWGEVFAAAIVLSVISLILYALAIVFFRNREMAIYSGH
ncbi:MAG: hypothetical protein AAF356_08045 [Planctomycetota bacterium]